MVRKKSWLVGWYILLRPSRKIQFGELFPGIHLINVWHSHLGKIHLFVVIFREGMMTRAGQGQASWPFCELPLVWRPNLPVSLLNSSWSCLPCSPLCPPVVHSRTPASTTRWTLIWLDLSILGCVGNLQMGSIWWLLPQLWGETGLYWGERLWSCTSAFTRLFCSLTLRVASICAWMVIKPD